MEKERKNVLLLGFTSFFNDISSEAIYGLLPFYVKDSGEIGVIGGLFNGLGSIFKFLFGYLSDKIKKRKPLVVFGYFISALSKLMIAISKGPLLILAILGDRSGKGIRTSPRDAILSEAKLKGHAFGLHRALDTLGALTGSFLIYLFLKSGWNVKKAMIFAAFIGFLSLFPLIFVEEPKIKISRKKLEKIKLSKESKKFLVGTFFVGLASISPMILIGQASKVIGAESLLIYTLYNVFYVFSAKKFGSLSDFVGRIKVLIFSSFLISLSFILASFGGKLLLLSFLIYGIGVGGIMSTAPAEMSDLEREAKGTALGIYHMVYGIGVLISSIYVGKLIKFVGNTAFLLPAIAGFISLPFYFMLK